MKRLVAFLALLVTHTDLVRGKNVLQILKDRSTYNQFANLLETTNGVHTAYLDNYVTVFAPSNAALAEYKGDKGIHFILNHLASSFPQSNLQTVNSAVSEKEVEQRLTSLLQGHPPLWIRKVRGELYVNQAKVSLVLPTQTADGKKQFLYLLDSVLEPLTPIRNNVSDFVDIKAGNIITDAGKYNIGEFSVKKFADQVMRLGLEKFPQLSTYGKFTFLIPVDSAYKDLHTGLIDEEVVRSHIVPGQLLFTKPLNKVGTDITHFNSLQHKSNSMEVKVSVAVYEGSDGKVKVQSVTEMGSRNHRRGKVIANIVKGNIMVQNGVIHLIDKPLVILANTLWESLDPSNPVNRRYSKFAEYVSANPELRELIESATSDDSDDNKNGATIFAPTNAAFEALSKSDIDSRLEEHPELLGYHFLNQIVEANDIRIRNPQSSWGMFSSAVGYPASSSKRVWLWNSTSGDKLYVDGGGVEALVVESDIRATNGIIHVIDKVLGMPVSTVAEKLEKDPMTQKTNLLGKQNHFNRKFKDDMASFTYLVPSDQAWQLIHNKYASAYKVLFLGDFFYQTHHILERHLKVGEKLSIERLLEGNRTLETLRGPPLTFYTETVDGELATMVKYNDVSARVVRANLECKNGYIHIIDNVIMKRRDVTLSSSLGLFSSLLLVTATFLLSYIIR